MNEFIQIETPKGAKILYMRFTKNFVNSNIIFSETNRPIRETGVKKYCKLMSDNEWRTFDRTQSPILLNSIENNKYLVVGGQHRIKGFVESSLEEMVFPVAFEATKDEISNQDDQINRSFNDRMVMQEGFKKDTANLKLARSSAAGKILYTLETGKTGDAKEVAATLCKYNEVLSKIDQMASGKIKKSAPVLAAFMWTYNKMETKKWEAVFNQIDNGTDLVKNSPEWKLAKAMHDKNNTRRLCLFANKAIGVLKAIHEGRQVKNITESVSNLTW